MALDDELAEGVPDENRMVEDGELEEGEILEDGEIKLESDNLGYFFISLLGWKDGTWSSIRTACTDVRDFKDICYHSYFSVMDVLLESTGETLMDISNTIWTFAKHMQELTKMIHRMVLQSLGIEKYFDCHIEPKTSGLRLSEYGIPLDQKTKAGMSAHTDPNMLTIVCQHQIEGLEVQTKGGEWIHVVPLPNSFTIMIGEAFKVWTNRRFQPPLHRVKMTGNEKRYSALFGMRPSDDCMMQPLDELADDDHPLLFKPFNYKEYIKFLYSEEGKKCKDTMEAFCGLGSET